MGVSSGAGRGVKVLVGAGGCCCGGCGGCGAVGRGCAGVPPQGVSVPCVDVDDGGGNVSLGRNGVIEGISRPPARSASSD